MCEITWNHISNDNLKKKKKMREGSNEEMNHLWHMYGGKRDIYLV